MLQTFLITALQTSPPFNAYLLDEDFLEYLLNLIIISLSLSPPLAHRGSAFSVAALGLLIQEVSGSIPARVSSRN